MYNIDDIDGIKTMLKLLDKDYIEENGYLYCRSFSSLREALNEKLLFERNDESTFRKLLGLRIVDLKTGETCCITEVSQSSDLQPIVHLGSSSGGMLPRKINTQVSLRFDNYNSDMDYVIHL